jgi:hypothetical protein
MISLSVYQLATLEEAIVVAAILHCLRIRGGSVALEASGTHRNITVALLTELPFGIHRQ